MSSRPSPSLDKLLWVKFGWSDFYRGGPVDGNFPWIKGGEQGHEAWNFLRQSDGTYYCYTPPQGGSGTPWNPDLHGWTVVCLAKDPHRQGVNVVGWYEDAELMGKYEIRPDGFDPGGVAPSDEYYYSIRAKKAFLVPPQFRTNPFSHTSIRQGKYSFLAGPNVVTNDNKREVRAILEERLRRLKNVAIENPDVETAPDRDNDEIDPLSGFGDAEHRKSVEVAAVEAAKAVLGKQGYNCVSRENDNVGFDLEATHKNGSTLHVEVKGTASKLPRFFLTANEHGYREASEWRLAMVVDALSKPQVQIYDLREFEREFEIAPMVWKGTKRTQL
jgi:hypothetical protein